ncbi:MAG: L-glutamate gamma-semialdehyde dehydrogenase [Thermostichales cyanobacterium BF3_bins_165]
MSTEARLQAIAQRLFQATHDQSWLGKVADSMKWDDKLLAVAMDHPRLRLPLFQLIDCLPSLSSKSEIARHMQEYLGDPQVELPGFLKGLLNFAQPDSLAAQLAATSMETAIQTLARKYIAGETLKQALKTIEGLRREKLAFTLDLLGEAVITEAEAQAYLDRYLEIMGQLAQAAQHWPTIPQIDSANGMPLPKVQVSVKLTAFYSQFDPLDVAGTTRQVSERVRILLRRAGELGVGVHFDMEQYRYKTLTLAILKQVLLEPEFRQRRDIGLTLQAYLRDSEADLQGLIAWAGERGAPVTVRLVKGAYWDQETIRALQKHWPQPVFSRKSDTDWNFERLTTLLLSQHQVLGAAIASHNIRSLAHAIATAEAHAVPPGGLELQVLYGMADKLAKVLAQQGQRVRVYCPYGELIPGMAYLIRRLLENTANSSFLLQSSRTSDPSQLLQPPPPPQPPVPASAEPGSFVPAADTDFSQPAHQAPFWAALQQVKARLGQTYTPLVNGRAVASAERLTSVNPAHPDQVVGYVGMATPADADQAIAAAQAAAPTWARTPVAERAECLRRASNLLADRRPELCAWMVLEVGKPWAEADAEVTEAIDFCRYYAAEMERLAQGYNRDVAGETNRYHYQPRGLAAVISPWNFPLAITTGMTVAALVTGNCVLLKPAEQASVIAAHLVDILYSAGIPKGVLHFLPGIGEEVGAHLVTHPQIHLIAFTGSQAVGCWIYAEAAKLRPGQRHVKRVIAEMGGKNAIIVDASADLDQAVQGIVQSAFGFAGQKCSACSRVIALESIHDPLVKRLGAAIASLAVGDPQDPAFRVGPVIDGESQSRLRQALERAKGYLEISVPVPEEGYYVAPTLISDVDPQSDLAQKELFGPVVAVLKAKTFQQALEIANATPYALTGGVYSRTPSHIAQAQAEFQVGNLYINRGITGAIVDRQPFGGFKLSGVGSKAGGPDYLLQFLEPRVVTENIQRQGFAPLGDLLL